MKRLFLVFLASMTLCSCSKEYRERSQFQRYADAFSGIYVCTSAVWEGDDKIDMNDDSYSSSDLFREFEGIDNAISILRNRNIRVHSPSGFEKAEPVYVYYPLQGLFFNTSTKRYENNYASNGLFSFDYMIHKDGSVDISAPEKTILYHFRPLDAYDEYYVSDIQIVKFGDDELSFKMTIRVYDYATNKLILDGPVCYTYTRPGFIILD